MGLDHILFTFNSLMFIGIILFCVGMAVGAALVWIWLGFGRKL